MELKIVNSTEKDIFGDSAVIRQTVFVEEQGFRDEFDETDKTAFHFVAYDGEKAVGTARMFGEGDTYHVGRFAVLIEYRGRDVGLRIMNEMERFAKGRGIARIVLSAQRRAVGFYEKLGYRTYGEEYLDENYPHIEMRKEL